MYGKGTLMVMVAATLVGFLATPSFAADPATKAPAKWMESCQTDLQSFCKDDKVKNTPAACLKAHEKDLSPTCQEAFLAPYMIMELCQTDINRFCKKPGGHVGNCLLTHRIELDADCRDAVLRAEKTFPPDEKPAVAADTKTAPAKATAKKRPIKRKKKPTPAK